jgi:DNA invertase Pin-like site-specific DNA recombinase
MGMEVLREIGYARVSTNEQDDALQLAALRGQGCEMIFTESMSGTKRHRPALDAMLAELRPGDRVNVWKVDRLGRSTLNSLIFVQELFERKVAFRSLTQPIDTSTPAGLMMLQMLMVFSEFERNTIVERVRAGLAIARQNGIIGGTRRSLTGDQVSRAQEAYANRPVSPRTGKAMTVSELADLFGVHRATFLRWAQPAYFDGPSKDAARFRARHANLAKWLKDSDNPAYGNSPNRPRLNGR